MASKHQAQASARGRNTVSKPLSSSAATASSKSKQTAGLQRAQSTGSTSLTKSSANTGATKNSSIHRTASAGANARPKLNANTATSKLDNSSVKPKPVAKDSVNTNVPVAKADTSSSSKPATAKQSTSTPPIEEETPTRTSDPLQVAAQVYPWMYMTSTLEACFQSSEEVAKNDLETRAKQISEEESELADQRIRLEAERSIDFYDALATDTFARDAPIIMKTYHSHGDACTRLEAEALELALHGSAVPDDDAPLQVYAEMLDSLEELQAEASDLESSIVKLTSSGPAEDDATVESTSARGQIIGVISACLPVLRARIANLVMAQDLIDSAQENLSISLRMESLGLDV